MIKWIKDWYYWGVLIGLVCGMLLRPKWFIFIVIPIIWTILDLIKWLFKKKQREKTN